MAVDPNLIVRDDLAKVNEIEFTYRFGENVKKLVEALGVTRVIAKTAGTNLKAYKATGELEDGSVPEGELIPLSHYKVEEVTFKEIDWKKYRKETTAEAIADKGYYQAHTMTTEALLKDVQKSIRKEFFDFLKTGTGVATGSSFQEVMAQSWGQLQVLFEDDDVDLVHFVNPLTVSSYLSQAQISTQTAFGLTYVQDFLGLGTMIMNASVPVGKIYSTAKENIILYYIPVNGADLGMAFSFTADETGYIGIHEGPTYETLTDQDVVMTGMTLFAEKIDGVIVGTVGN